MKPLTQADLDRLKAAGIEYPWMPQQSLRLLDHIEKLSKRSYTCKNYPRCTCRRQITCVMGSAHPEYYQMGEDW